MPTRAVGGQLEGLLLKITISSLLFKDCVGSCASLFAVVVKGTEGTPCATAGEPLLTASGSHFWGEMHVPCQVCSSIVHPCDPELRIKKVALCLPPSIFLLSPFSDFPFLPLAICCVHPSLRNASLGYQLGAKSLHLHETQHRDQGFFGLLIPQ